VFPRIQGADACGFVVAAGAAVDPARIGERVLVEPAFRVPAGPASRAAVYFGSERNGAFAEFTTVPAAHAYRVTSPLTDVELASFPCAYSAAENLLSRSAVDAGETVLVTGASGGVGSAAVQLATRRRATVLAITHPSKAALVGSLGASRVLPRDADLVAELGRESVDVVLDVVGGRQFSPLLEVLRRGGRYATAGAIAGPIVAPDLRTLYLKDLRLAGLHGAGSGGLCASRRLHRARRSPPGGQPHLSDDRDRRGAAGFSQQTARGKDRAAAVHLKRRDEVAQPRGRDRWWRGRLQRPLSPHQGSAGATSFCASARS
jgi:NADPH:quinone reductase-like Zn-dependent oxidoreductase